MGLFFIWFSYIIIGTLLLIGKAIACRILGIYHNHYQIGYSPVFARFKLLNVTFSVGIVIPLPWLFKIYEIHNGAKQRISPIWTRREFPLLRRLAGILGGIAFLYLISILIYAIQVHTTEDVYLSMNDVNKDGVCVDSLGAKLGLRKGDKIIKMDGETFERFTDLRSKLFNDKLRSLTIVRKGSVQEISINKGKFIDSMILSYQVIYPIIAKYPLKVDSVIPGLTAYSAGLEKGDKLITLNGDTICCFYCFTNALKRNKDSSIVLGINRNEQKSLRLVKVKIDNEGRMGILPVQTLPYTVEKKSFIKSLNAGNLYINTYLKEFKGIFVSEPKYQNVGGFITIGNLFPSRLQILRVLSIILLTYLCWSLIPTPITDGRFIVAILIDKIIRLPSNAATWIGWIVFVSFLIIANAVDLLRIFN